MKQWYMVVDVARCQDCNNCFLACKDEYCDNDHPPYSSAQPWLGHRWMDILRKERGQYPKVDVAYLPYMCMHCEEASCMDKAKGAIYRKDSGIVIIDPKKAKGRKDLVDSCPYGAIYWNEEKKIPQKCTFCVHLLEEGWKNPRCVQACPTGALSALLLDSTGIEKLKKSDGLSVYQPQFNTSPRVYYKNIHKFSKCFIAGSVALKEKNECAEGVKVALLNEATRAKQEAVTNNFGDFKFDNLEQDGEFRITIESSGHDSKVVMVVLEKSTDVGTIYL